MSLWDDALAGALEEVTRRKAERLEDRIRNCGRPYDWLDKLTGQWRIGFQFCKHWSCDYCNTRRAMDEKDRMERALSEYDSVYAIFDISDRQWPKLARLFNKSNITSNMYRRLPQDDRKVTVFFVGNASNEIKNFATIVKIQDDTIVDDGDFEHTWFDLAKKREGKRTSGNLGKEIEPQPTGPELTSVRIVAVRGEKGDNGAVWFDKQRAMKQADEATNVEPQDKEHLEELIEQAADAYESALQEMGCKTYRVVLYRKMDLALLEKEITSIQKKEKRPIDIKSTEHSQKLAQEYLYPREIAEI